MKKHFILDTNLDDYLATLCTVVSEHIVVPTYIIGFNFYVYGRNPYTNYFTNAYNFIDNIAIDLSYDVQNQDAAKCILFVQEDNLYELFNALAILFQYLVIINVKEDVNKEMLLKKYNIKNSFLSIFSSHINSKQRWKNLYKSLIKVDIEHGGVLLLESHKDGGAWD